MALLTYNNPSDVLAVQNALEASLVTLATGNTIGTSRPVAHVTTTAAVTGVIMAAGIVDGQIVIVEHQGAAANTITMAAAATSNVADGASDVITGPSTRMFRWNAVTALWYKVG